MTRNSYISMVVTNAAENNPNIDLESAYLRAVATADFLESKQVAPWQEPLRFRVTPPVAPVDGESQPGQPPVIVPAPTS